MRTEKGTKDFFFLKKLFGGRWEWENGPKSSLTLWGENNLSLPYLENSFQQIAKL